ncbi:hypothetical protein C8J57DRAFT_1231345 [Mycena rebaudengoi]|nr:hypothetical protein C8J57DRAFT_1231345 [Mycena rebaudengoi]
MPFSHAEYRCLRLPLFTSPKNSFLDSSLGKARQSPAGNCELRCSHICNWSIFGGSCPALRRRVLTFWCFVEYMDRMKQNFLCDQSGTKKQLLTLQELIGVMDPELYRHLEIGGPESVLLSLGPHCVQVRISVDDVLRLWEVLWTDYYSNEFVLFVTLAVIESHCDVILRYLVEVRSNTAGHVNYIVLSLKRRWWITKRCSHGIVPSAYKPLMS